MGLVAKDRNWAILASSSYSDTFSCLVFSSLALEVDLFSFIRISYLLISFFTFSMILIGWVLFIDRRFYLVLGYE